MESVVREARNLIEGGVRELLVIAQDITVYGNDRPESGDTLARLLTALNALEGNFVIRLLYTHPAHYTEEFIDFMARGNTKVLPYLDIPLQHISDRILKQMNRHVTRKQTEELLTKLRERIPGLTLRTTFITGFPGETEEEYQELKSFAKKFKFERCGVFPYSPEPRTPAAAFPDQVPAFLFAVAKVFRGLVAAGYEGIFKRSHSWFIVLREDNYYKVIIKRGLHFNDFIDTSV